MNKNFFKGYDEAVSYILEIPRFSAKNDTNITKEFLSLIHKSNELKPYAFYIVDSFGVMKRKDLIRLSIW